MLTPIRMAISEYDHVRDLVHGIVPIPGVQLSVDKVSPPDIFDRFMQYREWDVCEFSLAKYVALRAAGDVSVVGIPVFPSRLFRHDSIFVREDGPQHPAELAGCAVGVPEWAQSAAVYVRALLQHEWDVDIRDISWVQAGLNQAGRTEKVQLSLPGGLRLASAGTESLNALLLKGDLDAIVSAHPPEGATGPETRLRRMRCGGRAVEEEYARRTGIFPIMHVVVMRADVANDYPWLATSLCDAFEQSKRNSIARICDTSVSRFPVPWLGGHLEEVSAVIGDDPWPYGIEPNEPTLSAFVQYCAEQGVADRAVPVDELFARRASDVLWV